jgi:hypothetical protein
VLSQQSGTALAASVCPLDSSPAFRSVGGRRFDITTVTWLSGQLSGRGEGCDTHKHLSGLERVAALKSAAMTNLVELVGATVVIVIDDFGYRNDWVVEGFIKLDAAVTLAVIPGRQFSSSIAERAHERGHEVLLHMPMQALGPAPGEAEYRLTTAMSATEIKQRVRQAISEMPQAVGMNNHQGSAVTGDARVIRVLADELYQQDLFFLDSVTTAQSVAVSTMRAGGVAAARRDLFLDHVDDLHHILAQLDLLVQMAHEYGYAVGIGHVRPNTLLALQQALPHLLKYPNHRLAPLSAVVRLTP